MLIALLRFFGLVTINRAKFISGEIVATFTKQIQIWAKEDFKREENPAAINDSRKWAEDAFEVCSKNNEKIFEIEMPHVS